MQLTEKTDNARVLKILIAEDNEVNQKVLRIILDKRGHSYEIAGNGHDVVKKFESGRFDLILMDCQMPTKDGLQASREIREIELKSNKQRCPIIAMTANAMSGDKEKCLEAGMDDFLAKPFKSQDLDQVVKTWSANIKSVGEKNE